MKPVMKSAQQNPNRNRMRRSMTLALFVTATAIAFSGCNRGNRINRAAREREQQERMAAEAEQFMMEAETLKAAGDDKGALEALAKAVEINPTLFRAHMGMADIYREQGNNDFAVRQYRKSVDLNPKSYDANYFLGLCLQLADRLNEAIRAYRRAIAIDPDSHEANLNVATAYLQNDQPIEALPFAVRAAELQPDHGPTHINLAAIYASVGKHAKAVEQYRIAAELIELPPSVLLNFADSLRVLKRYPEMINSLEALIRIEPMPAAYERLGYAFFKAGKFEQSKDAYRQAVSADPQYYPALNGLAVNLLNEYIMSGHVKAESRQKAVELLRESVQIESNQPRIVDLLSRYGR